MLIWMKHKDHGKHPCYSNAEAEECKKNGWVSIEEEKAAINEDSIAFHTETDYFPIPKKRGRPPKG